MSSQGEEREQGSGGRWEARGGVTGWSGGSLQISWRRQDRESCRAWGAPGDGIAAQMKATGGGRDEGQACEQALRLLGGWAPVLVLKPRGPSR